MSKDQDSDHSVSASDPAAAALVAPVGAPSRVFARGECHNSCRFKTECPNMKEREGDLSMTYEHYDCAVCGAHVALDYDEMR